TTTVEIKPTFELREYKGITLKQDKRSITDEELDKAMQVIRQQHAQIEILMADRGMAEDDYAQLHVEMLEGSTPVSGAAPENHLVRVGDKTPVLGVALDEALLGKKKGDVVDVPQDYPAEYADARLAGKTVTIRAQVQAPLDTRKLREEFLPKAKERVKLGLVLDAIAEKEGITVIEADVEQECRMMARGLKIDPAEVMKILASGGRETVDDFKSRI